MSKKSKIFFLDDNIEYAQMFFEDTHEDFQIYCHEDPRTAIEAILTSIPDLIILDVHMPFKNGFTIFNEIKRNNSLAHIPVLFLSSDDSDDTVLSHLDLGPEDFLFKSMSPIQVKKRIQNRLHTVGQDKKVFSSTDSLDNISYGNLQLNHKEFKVLIDSNEIDLTNTEYRILFFILKNHEARPTKEELVKFVWGEDYVVGRTVNTHFSNLRFKISQANFVIKIGRIENRIRIIDIV